MTVDSVDEVIAPPEQWIPGLTTKNSRYLSVWSAFPYLLGGSMADHAFWLHIDLIDVDVHTVTWHLLTHPRHLNHFPNAEVDRRFEILELVHTEDMATCRRVQAGLTSGLFDRPRLTDLDTPIADFHRWYRDQRHTAGD